MKQNHFGIRFAGVAGLVAILACGCGDSEERQPIAFGAEGNRLLAYETREPWAVQTVIERYSEDPGGWDINGQICFKPDGSGRFIAGEDTGQPTPPAGYGFFQLAGRRVGELSATRVGKLTPTYQESRSQPEPYGCGFLKDGRLLTTDVGNQSSGPPTGQLIIWFPPFDGDSVSYCKLDIGIGTAGGIFVDDQDRAYVASARETAGVFRFDPPYPTSNQASGGCGRLDATGAPLADRVQRENFIVANPNSPTPNAVAPSARDSLYVSSVFNGVIAEYDFSGDFIRRILEPPAGETLGPVPFSTGTPMGIAVDRSGRLFYADLGIRVSETGIGPGRLAGSYRVIEFIDGKPQAPRTLASGLAFPDGAGVME
ncbi:MAG TPA: hypothetical protein DCG06_09885 [Deltaproteobacteria bacterium]|nr:hypothetical protein [Deltaproteobacteria bacterium]